jgi:HlyD family secretion protein
MKKLLIGLVLVAVVLIGGIWIWNQQTRAEPLPPRRALVGRSDIVEKVSATARVQPVDVYYVSSDVPYARVSEIMAGAEVGKEVKKGEELLRLDDQMARVKVDEANAAVATAESVKLEAEGKLASAEAYLGVAEAEEKLALQDQKSAQVDLKDLASQGARDRAAMAVAKSREGINLAKSQIKQAEAAVLAADANIKKAKAGLTAANENLKMLVVTSPIDGTIIDKKVTSAGQVISPQTHPVLFAIVSDLNKFELEAQVGEADISKVRKGMSATFKVDAYAEDDTTFEGEVTQIAFVPTITASRLTESSTSGPVVYKVTLTVKPYTGSQPRPLKPGLTANVDLIVKRVKKALHVPNAALNYQPDDLSQEQLKQIQDRQAKGWRPIWAWKAGKAELLFVETGANDGERNEILKFEEGELKEGMEVIVEGPPKPANGGLFNQQIKIM